MLVVLCAERSVDGGGVCRKKKKCWWWCGVQKEVLILVVCVQKEKGSVDVGGGLCAERKKKC